MKKEDISLFFTYVQSQETAFDYLCHCYQQQNVADAEAKSYKNANAFMYYAEHGIRFIEQAMEMDLLLRPVLLFYGASHLFKACLLTKRPDYPESTSILAHGVSTRKRKKKNYTFMSDEVKTQHKGLFTYIAKHLYNMDTIPFEKIKMEELLSLIPEINPLFAYTNEERLVPVGKKDATSMFFPLDLLDSYMLTEHAFVKRVGKHLPEITAVTVHSGKLNVELSKPVSDSTGPFFQNSKGEIYFPKDRNHFLPFPETLVHYLVLYNLSMISRYETEWWGELLNAKAEIDFPFIKRFLQISAEKVPLSLGNDLVHQFKRSPRK
ncbi:YaaC family protein [Virgibacillus siamensis]|uniref:YaaC family protein n=1 Tax=Virgibacillus siamensis TaxID=480071 RepID=UPI00098605B8|nr:YaaC family protein [Virgibacillus siamensis]